MKVTRTTIIERDITSCYHQCSYFEVEGTERIMVCQHPQAPGDAPYKGWGVIICPECMTGFPKDCPLTKPKRNDGPQSNEHTIIH